MKDKASRIITLLGLALSDTEEMNAMMRHGFYSYSADEWRERQERCCNAVRVAGELMAEMATVAVIHKAMEGK